MPFEINLGMPPAGYSLNSARKGETAEVQYLEFTSTEDGQHFIGRLEGFPTEVLGKLPTQNSVTPSQVDSLLAVVRLDGTATVYVNEVPLTASVRICRSFEKGEAVTKNDVVDVERLELGVSIPDDCGVMFLFSVGWRKGLFYDFGPVGRDRMPRKYDCGSVLGQAYCHVLFQERFGISNSTWDALFQAKWFPFAGLRHETITRLVTHVQCGWDPSEITEMVATEVRSGLSNMLDSWRKHASFASHVQILERAVERFQVGDNISCTSLLYPRIEGILRTHHNCLGITQKPTADNLTKTAVAAKAHNEKCLLLPDRFARYLKEVYFASFNPIAQQIDVSRHSVAHGVADASEFNLKSSLIGLLVVNQLFYFLDPQQVNIQVQSIPSAQSAKVIVP